MNSNSSSLFSLAHDLLTYGLDGSPIYADQFTRLNRDVYERAIELYNIHGATAEEEAELCLALLVAFAATITWDETGLSREQAEIAEELKGFEENQYPFEEVEE